MNEIKNKEYKFKLMAKKENYNSVDRVKYQVLSLDQDSNIPSESQNLLEMIE